MDKNKINELLNTENRLPTGAGMILNALGIPQEKLGSVLSKLKYSVGANPYGEAETRKSEQVSDYTAKFLSSLVPYTTTPKEMAIGATFGGPQAKGWQTAERKFSSLYDKKPRFEINDKGAIWNPEISKNNLSPMTAIEDYKYGFGRDARVKDIFHHEELFKNYPEIADAKLVSSRKGMLNSEAGSYDPETNTIFINTSRIDKDPKETLLHEIQHAIQEKEGFARGGSPSAMQLEYNNTKARLNFLEKEPDYRAGLAEREKLWNRVFGTEELDENIAIKIDKAITEKHPALKESQMILDKLRKLKDDSGYEAYKNLAGEIESRDVSARMPLTAEERMRKMPYSSENIPIENAIVRFDKNALAQQISPVYHGSPHRFNKFSNEKIGSGEGAQAFGYGHYLTESPEVAKTYSKGTRIEESIPQDIKDLLNKVKKEISGFRNVPITDADVLADAHKIAQSGYSSFFTDDLIKELVKNKDRLPKGNLYEATLHKGKQPGEYNYLEWDKSTNSENIDKIINQAKKENITGILKDKDSFKRIRGNETYTLLTSHLGEQSEVSNFLKRAGIDGIKYPTGSLSGIKGSDKYNYVVFDPKDITIEAIK